MEFFTFIETEVLTALTSWYKWNLGQTLQVQIDRLPRNQFSYPTNCWHSPMSLQYGVVWSEGGGGFCRHEPYEMTFKRAIMRELERGSEYESRGSDIILIILGLWGHFGGAHGNLSLRHG